MKPIAITLGIAVSSLVYGCVGGPPAPDPQTAPVPTTATPKGAVATAETADRRTVIRTIERLFEGMRTRDTAMLRSLLDPDLVLVSARDSGDGQTLRRQSVEAFLRSIAAAPEELVERFRDPEVRLDGAIASVWAPYDFHIGSRFSHCGHDAFQLARRRGEWMIIGLAYTVRTRGCPSAPAAPGGTAESMPSGAGRSDSVEAISLLGEPLYRPVIPAAARARFERELAEARAAHERTPHDADSIIWLGRRTAYLGRFREAIAIFSDGIRRHPDDARMYRHRGHRYITVRHLDSAVADLEQAAQLIRGGPDEIEPDGMPNRHGVPTSTLHTNIWYHLGLAHYLRGDFERAERAYEQCMRAATNDDMRVATADWWYMTLRRLGRDSAAARLLEPIHPGMRILENHAYHRRLLMYKGELPPDSLLAAGEQPDALQMATQGYGVGNWFLYNGDERRAKEIFERVLSYGNWPAFGHIAAEVELRRMRSGRGAGGSRDRPGPSRRFATPHLRLP